MTEFKSEHESLLLTVADFLIEGLDQLQRPVLADELRRQLQRPVLADELRRVRNATLAALERAEASEADPPPGVRTVGDVHGGGPYWHRQWMADRQRAERAEAQVAAFKAIPENEQAVNAAREMMWRLDAEAVRAALEAAVRVVTGETP